MELLQSLGLDVNVVPSGYHEPDRAGLSPFDLALEHARAKCEAIAMQFPSDLVVAADTVVDVDGTAYNKPKDAADARRMLTDLSGRTHLVHTALAISAAGTVVVESESTRVTFFPLERSEIDRYIESGEPFDKAGGYGIQAHGAALVERIDGDFYTVMGFPLARFMRTLRRLGIVLPITK